MDRDADVIAALAALVAETPRWGFWRRFDARRLVGHRWNRKRVYRVQCALKLSLKRRSKPRLPPLERQPLNAPDVLNGMWAVDCMSDMLYSGMRFGCRASFRPSSLLLHPLIEETSKAQQTTPRPRRTT